jgi:hypothetical protein
VGLEPRSSVHQADAMTTAPGHTYKHEKKKNVWKLLKGLRHNEAKLDLFAENLNTRLGKLPPGACVV